MPRSTQRLTPQALLKLTITFCCVHTLLVRQLLCIGLVSFTAVRAFVRVLLRPIGVEAGAGSGHRSAWLRATGVSGENPGSILILRTYCIQAERRGVGEGVAWGRHAVRYSCKPQSGIRFEAHLLVTKRGKAPYAFKHRQLQHMTP